MKIKILLDGGICLFTIVLTIISRPFNIPMRWLSEDIIIDSVLAGIIIACFWVGTRAIVHKIVDKYRSRLLYAFLSILCVLFTVLFGEFIILITHIDPLGLVSFGLSPVVFTGLVWGFWSSFLLPLSN